MGVPLGKWTKHKLLLKESSLIAYLPETKILTKNTFTDFLERYGQAIIKPSFGSLGKRVFKVIVLGNDQYEIHGGSKKEIIDGELEAYEIVRSRVSRKKNIIQQVIPLATKNGFPFDIRVMVQRRPGSGEWVITGKAAKVAGRGYFVTNVAREVLPVEVAIQGSNIAEPLRRTKEIERELNETALKIVHALQFHYPNKNEMGIDFGLDENGKIWIIEVNMKPMIRMFSLLQDKSMLEEIKKIRGEHKKKN